MTDETLTPRQLASRVAHLFAIDGVRKAEHGCKTRANAKLRAAHLEVLAADVEAAAMVPKTSGIERAAWRDA